MRIPNQVLFLGKRRWPEFDNGRPSETSKAGLSALASESLIRPLHCSPRPITQEALDQIDRFKRDTNVTAKLGNIAEAFGADTDLRMHMSGLSKARNALTLNMGFVGPLHCTHPGELQLSWIGPEIEIGGRVAGADFEPVVVEQAQNVLFRFAPRARNIAVGRPIELSPHDLHEICLTYWFQATKLIAEMGRVLADWGIGPAREKSRPELVLVRRSLSADHALLAAAWRAVNDKARELGWIV